MCSYSPVAIFIISIFQPHSGSHVAVIFKGENAAGPYNFLIITVLETPTFAVRLYSLTETSWFASKNSSADGSIGVSISLSWEGDSGHQALHSHRSSHRNHN